MLVSHSKRAFVDVDELERTSGLMSTLSKESDNALDSAILHGAAKALEVMETHDLKSAEDFAVVFKRLVFNETTERKN